MIWSLTGNLWLDKWIKKANELAFELHTSACAASPLDAKDKADLEKCLEKLNKINTRVRKRIDKARKGGKSDSKR